MQIYSTYINGITNIKVNFTVSFYSIKSQKLQRLRTLDPWSYFGASKQPPQYPPPFEKKKFCKPTCTSMIANHAQYVQFFPTFVARDDDVHVLHASNWNFPVTPPPPLFNFFGIRAWNLYHLNYERSRL